jgi:hypothetical protein
MENQSASQCADCLAVNDGPETDCPVCQAAGTADAATADGSQQFSPDAEESNMNISTRPEQAAQTAPPPPAANAAAPNARDAAASTLIEFPVAGRGPRPQWRKELSERVREIQQRKAQEAARESGETALNPAVAYVPAEEADATDAAPQLGLVPEAPVTNPIVARALEKIERARRAGAATAARPSARNGATHAAAAARVVEERRSAAEPVEQPARAETVAPPGELIEAAAAEVVEAQAAEETAEPARTHNLVVVPPPAPQPSET